MVEFFFVSAVNFFLSALIFSLFISFLLASMCECASVRVYIWGLFAPFATKHNMCRQTVGYNCPIRPVFLLFWRQNVHFWIFSLTKTVLVIEHTSKRPRPEISEGVLSFFRSYTAQM